MIRKMVDQESSLEPEEQDSSENQSQGEGGLIVRMVLTEKDRESIMMSDLLAMEPARDTEILQRSEQVRSVLCGVGELQEARERRAVAATSNGIHCLCSYS